jgi:hypothetical protein
LATAVVLHALHQRAGAIADAGNGYFDVVSQTNPPTFRKNREYRDAGPRQIDVIAGSAANAICVAIWSHGLQAIAIATFFLNWKHVHWPRG